MDVAEIVLSSLLKFDGYPDALALPRDQRQRYQERAKAVATALETLQRERDEAVSSAAAARANFHTMQNAANELRKERDEAREALDRANDYLRFVARWAWRESEGLTDVERLSAIKYYPPIKALAAGEPAPLSLKGNEDGSVLADWE